MKILRVVAGSPAERAGLRATKRLVIGNWGHGGDPDGGVAPSQMPPVLVRTTDEAAMQDTKDWINSLP